MAIRIKNWKLTLLGLLVVCLLASLGFWQLARSQRKKILLESFKTRTQQPALDSAALNPTRDLRFYRAKLTGTFDNAHSLLLDNKTYQGKIGYELYTPFKAVGLTHLILIDRGFIPVGQDRNTLPAIKPINGKVTLQGMLNYPPTYVAFGGIADAATITWPLRVEYIETTQLAKILESNLLPYILTLDPQSPYALSASAIEWHIFTVSPERHMAYAFQWFALATTLLVICAVLNRN